MDTTRIAALWVADLEKQVWNSAGGQDVWEIVRQKLNTDRITAHDGMSMGHLSHRHQNEIRREAIALVDGTRGLIRGRIAGIRTG